MLVGRLVGVVVRRVGDGLVREVARLAGLSAIDHQVAIADPGMELDVGPAQARLDGLDQRAAFLARDMPGREIGQPAVVDRHEIAADGPVVGAQVMPIAAASSGARPV